LQRCSMALWVLDSVTSLSDTNMIVKGIEKLHDFVSKV
jgi:hypothetical protein